jgi:type IV pilus assembly protein PilA
MTEDRPAPPPPLPYPAYGQPQPARRPAWFWILVIGGCCTAVIFVLLILAAVAIPSMLRMRKNADESAATMTMRTIQSAEAAYNASYPANGYACSLATLGGDPATGPPTAQAAQLIDANLATTGQKSGYTFAIACGTKSAVNGHDVYTSYQLTAVPQIVGKTGDNGYCSDENNFILFDPTGGTNCPRTHR